MRTKIGSNLFTVGSDVSGSTVNFPNEANENKMRIYCRRQSCGLKFVVLIGVTVKFLNDVKASRLLIIYCSTL